MSYPFNQTFQPQYNSRNNCPNMVSTQESCKSSNGCTGFDSTGHLYYGGIPRNFGYNLVPHQQTFNCQLWENSEGGQLMQFCSGGPS